MKHKRQHVIPKCYLRAWCDPSTAPNEEPYIWLISKDGAEAKRRAPKKAFTANDKYTIRFPSGERQLVLEHTLTQIENGFLRSLGSISTHRALDVIDRARLCTFAAAMIGRTNRMAQHNLDFFRKVHDKVSAMESHFGAEPSLSKQTSVFADQGDKLSMAMLLSHMPPMLFQMSLTILETDAEIGFITSDDPCVLYNPKAYKLPPLFRSPGLGQPEIEVTLPLTPKQLALFTWTLEDGYLAVKEEFVDELNRRTRFYADEFFVSWKGKTKPLWFHAGDIPEDSWENTFREQEP